MGSRLELSRTAIVVWTALVALVLGGCQHPSPSPAATAMTTWRVLERVGDVRVAGGSGQSAHQLRPGETVSGDRVIAVGKASLLILAGEGVQLTAGEHTALRLHDNDADASLALDHGWLRVRLATAANRAVRIKSPVFDINTSRATLTLRAEADRSDLAVEDGSAVLTTMDGRHRATLVAGAAAKIGQGTGSELMIRPASGQTFVKVTPFPEHAGARDAVERPSIPKAQDSGSATREPSSQASTATERGRTVAILPASRLKPASPIVPDRLRAIGNEPPSTIPAVSQSTASDSSPSVRSAKPQRPDMTRPASEVVDDEATVPSTVLEASSGDPLQARFDRLTDGLLDGL